MCFLLLLFSLSFLGTWGGDGGGGIWLWVILADRMDRRSIVGRMQNPTYGFGDKSGGGGDDDDDDDASLKSGWSGETLGVERSGERRGSLMRRLFRRKRGEGKGGEEKGKSDDEGS